MTLRRRRQMDARMKANARIEFISWKLLAEPTRRKQTDAFETEIANVRYALGEASTKQGIVETEVKRKEEDAAIYKASNDDIRGQLGKEKTQSRVEVLPMKEELQASSAEVARKDEYLSHVRKAADSSDMDIKKFK